MVPRIPFNLHAGTGLLQFNLRFPFLGGRFSESVMLDYGSLGDKTVFRHGDVDIDGRDPLGIGEREYALYIAVAKD